MKTSSNKDGIHLEDWLTVRSWFGHKKPEVRFILIVMFILLSNHAHVNPCTNNFVTQIILSKLSCIIFAKIRTQFSAESSLLILPTLSVYRIVRCSFGLPLDRQRIIWKVPQHTTVSPLRQIKRKLWQNALGRKIITTPNARLWF